MGSLPNGFPVSLKSWPSKPNDATALPTLIQRINLERGGFVNISEESLQQEIAQAEAGDSGECNGSSDEEEAEEPDRAKELMAAREEMVGQIDSARQSSMYALDFVSLLLSKDTPVQASLSISPTLRDLVGMGTLGADKLQASRVTDAQKEDNKQVAKGWKIQNLNKTVDSILASATRLEKEIELETKYWEQVLAVSDNGWAVCRLPQAKHILGVRFGFSEASPAFKSQSLAALKRNVDGTISLDQGSAASEPQALRIRIQVDGEDTGSSSLPKPAPEDAPIEALILQARNTIFAAEIWQEMNREARTLGPFGVRAQGDTLIFPLSVDKTVVLDLVSLNEFSMPQSGADDHVAEGLSLTLNLLLSYSHRQSHRRRTFPPPPISSVKRPNPPYNLLRPLLTFLTHQNTLVALHAVLRPLTTALSKAALDPQPTYTLISSPSSAPAQLPTPERTIATFTDRLFATLTYKITESTSLIIIIRTSMTPLPASIFSLSLSPSSPLQITCPPASTLTSFDTVANYIYFATACSLAASFANTQPNAGDADAEGGWANTPHPSTLKLTRPKMVQTKQLTFSIHPLPSPNAQPRKGHSGQVKKGIKLSATWSFTSPNLSALSLESSTPTPTTSEGRNNSGSGENTSSGRRGSGSKRREGEGIYEWVAWEDERVSGWDDGEGEVFRALSDVVRDAAK